MLGGGYMNPSVAPAGGGAASITSGSITSGSLGDASVLSGTMGSGQISRFHVASGSIQSGLISSGTVLGRALGGPFCIASGSIGTFDIGSGQIATTLYGSGSIGPLALTGGKRRMTTDVQVSGTALTSGVLSALSCQLASGLPYRIQGVITTNFDGTGGQKIDLGGGTVTANSVVVPVLLVADGVGINTDRMTSLTTAVGAAPLGTAGSIWLEGTLVTTAAGTLIPRFAQNVANNDSTALAGSFLVCEQLAN